MSDYTPTTERVMSAYQDDRFAQPSGSGPGCSYPQAADEFDRWLADHDRGVAERAVRQERAWVKLNRILDENGGLDTDEYRAAWAEWEANRPIRSPGSRPERGRVMDEEVREYTVTAERSSFGRSTIVIRCPFCRHLTTAYVWSLAGSGKRCENRGCRALFDGRGRARGKAPDHMNRSE